MEFLIRPTNPKVQASTSSRLGLLVLLFGVALSQAAAQQNKPDASNPFRWIDAASQPQVWQQIQTAFRGELAPDEPKPGLDAHDVYRYKYLERVGIVGHSALVIVSSRPSKVVSKDQAWNTYSSAFTFDLNTQRKSSIGHAELCGSGNSTAWRGLDLHGCQT